MDNYRSIKKIIKAQKVDMGGILLDQALPMDGISEIDPFLLVHHLYHKYDKGGDQRNLGIGPHPHRGFSPVTFIFKGGVHHQDSLGNSESVFEGGTQWMNAGMGIIHSERPPKEIAENGGEQEIVQIWINTPKAHKMDKPSYQPFHGDVIPGISSDDGKVNINIFAGSLGNTEGPAKGSKNIIAASAFMSPGGEYTFTIPTELNTFIYILEGKLSLNNNETLETKNLAWFKNDSEKFNLRAIENTRLLILAGEPLHETTYSHGPFVMNSKTEILEAIDDYQTGKMGLLVEDFREEDS